MLHTCKSYGEVGLGSFATRPSGIARDLMSGFAPKATEALRRREMTRRAKSDIRHSFDYLIGAAEK
jgi:hypothetical protein